MPGSAALADEAAGGWDTEGCPVAALVGRSPQPLEAHMRCGLPECSEPVAFDPAPSWPCCIQPGPGGMTQAAA